MKNFVLVLMFLFISNYCFSQGEYNEALTSVTMIEDPEESDSLYIVLKYIDKAATKEFSTNYQKIKIERDNQTKAFFEFINTYDSDNSKLYDMAQKKNERNHTLFDCNWVMTMQFIIKNKNNYL